MNEALTTDLAPSVSGAVPSATGITAPSNPARQGAFLTDVIVELGFAEPSAVQQALTATHQSAKTPERFLLDSGVIDEWQLSLAVAERNGLGHVDLDQFEVDVEVAGLIDGPTASRYAALPIAFDTDGALLVAIEDPFNMLGISDIEVMTRNEVRPLIATGTQIQSLIKKLPAPERPVVAELPEPPPAPTTEPNGWPGAGSEDSPQPESESELTPKPMLAQSAEPAPAEQASALAEERAEFKRERQQSADRQRELEGELATSQESITSLEGRVFKLTDAADLAKSATKKLAKLQERERELEGELATAQECITSLAKRASKLADAADLAKSATKKLAKLQDVLQMADQSKAP